MTVFVIAAYVFTGLVLALLYVWTLLRGHRNDT